MVKAVDIWPGLLLLGLGIFILNNSQKWVIIGPNGPGPGFFPLIEGIALCGLSVALIAIAVRRKLAGEGLGGVWRNSFRALATWAALMAATLMMDTVGFLVSFALLTFFIVSVMYRRPLLVGSVVAIASTAGLYLCFTLALDVRLPTGLLDF